jgi:hypothetical protein
MNLKLKGKQIVELEGDFRGETKGEKQLFYSIQGIVLKKENICSVLP